MAAMKPEFDDETPINPFDFWEGANFKVKITKKDGYWNYDKSEFGSQEPLSDDDDVMEAIWKKTYSLAEFTDAEKMKSYEQLDARLKSVLGKKTAAPVDESFDDEDEDRGDYKKLVATPSKSRPQVEDDEDDALSYFQKLAEE